MSLIEYLSYALLWAFPCLMLNWQHSANGIYLLLSVCAVLLWFWHRFTPQLRHESTVSLPWFLAFWMYPAALLVQSLVMGSWSIKAWDTPSRFILAIPIIYLFSHYASVRLASVFHGAVLGVWVAFVTAILMISDHVDGRATTYFMHPTSFGNFAWILGILSLGAYRGSVWQRGWAISGCVAGLALAYASGTRAAWLAVISAAVVGVLCHTQITRRAKTMVVAALAMLVVVIYAGVPSVRERINLAKHEWTQPLSEVADTSVGLRRQYWQASWQLIQEHPILGVGRFQFVQEKKRMVDAGLLTQAASQYEHPHHELLFAWVELGILGLLGILSLYALPAYYCWQHRRSRDPMTRQMALLGLMVIVSYVVFGWVDVMLVAWVMQAPIYVMCVMMPIWVILARRREAL